MCSRPSMAVSSLPLHAGDPFSSFSIQVLSKLVNWEKSETIYKRIQTTDQYHPLCNFLKDQTDKQYLIAILSDFFNLRKLKKILLSSADKCSKSVFFQCCTGIEDVSAVQSIFNFYQILRLHRLVWSQGVKPVFSKSIKSQVFLISISKIFCM